MTSKIELAIIDLAVADLQYLRDIADYGLEDDRASLLRRRDAAVRSITRLQDLAVTIEKMVDIIMNLAAGEAEHDLVDMLGLTDAQATWVKKFERRNK